MSFRGVGKGGEAMPRMMMSDPSTVTSRIYIGSLPVNDSSFTKNDLSDMFSKYGNVTGVLYQRGFAFVQFDTEESALEAIKEEHGAMVCGKRIDVKKARILGGAKGPGGRPADHSSDHRPDNQRDRSPIDRDWGRDKDRDSFSNSGDPLPMDRSSMDRGDRERGPMDRERGPMDRERGPMDRERGPMDRERGPMDRERGLMDRERGPMDRERGPMDRERGPMDRERGPMDRERGPMDRGDRERGPMDRERGPMDRERGPMDRERGPMDRERGPMDRERGPMDRGDRERGPMDRGDRDRGPMNRGPMDISPMDRGPSDRGPMDRERDRGPMDRGGPIDRGPMDRGPMDRGPMSRGPVDRGPMDRGGFYGNGGPESFRGGSASFRPGPEAARAPPPNDYAAPVVNIASVDRTNDVEIIVFNKANREYGEYIERRLKQLGLTVDLLFPNEVVPIGRVLASICSRGTLYAIVLMPQNEEHRSLTLNILHGLPEGHRNMPLEDAIKLISRNFEVYIRGEKLGSATAGGSVPLPVAVQPARLTLAGGVERHPDPIKVLLTLLSEDRQLTVLQYDTVIRYLEGRREAQVKVELGDTKEVIPPILAPVSTKQEVELQHRILNILNSSAPPSVPPNTPATPPVWSPMDGGGAQNPLLSDPTVQKALDSLLQSKLLKNIGQAQNFRF